jgi:hypothetical protein
VDLFLGAQVDVGEPRHSHRCVLTVLQISKPLTNPATFQALTGITEPSKGKTETPPKWNFSEELQMGVSD